MPNKDFDLDMDIDFDIEEPKQCKVLLLNDDYSTMEFVIEILISIFHKTNDEAMQIMLNIHNNGKGVCGVYPHEIAHTKVAQVTKEARTQNFSLKAVVEEG